MAVTTKNNKTTVQLRRDLLQVVSETKNCAAREPGRTQALVGDLMECVVELEADIAAETSVPASRSPDEAIRKRCETALRTIYLHHTRISDSLDETGILRLLRDFQVVPVLLNEKEAVQAIRAKAIVSNSITVKEFLEIISICSLAFARPPHNAKVGTSEIQLWRFMGLTEGSWKKRLLPQ